MLELNKIYNEHCKFTLNMLPDNSVDLFLQDTPFGATQNDWDIPPDLERMWPYWLRVGKEKCIYIFFATQPFASDLINSNQEVFKYDIIWYKALGTGFLNAKKMPMRNHEHILLFYRKFGTYNPQMGVGNRKTGRRNNARTNPNYGKFGNDTAERYDDKGIRYPQSVIDFSNGDRTTEQDHPTQKPLDLIRYLVRTYSNHGDLVFDGYMGSGTTAAACIEEGRNFIGSEIKEDYFNFCQKRLRNIYAAPKLISPE